jgi:hypothetical protein
MAPLAPSNTPRYRFHYTVIANQHSLQLRSNGSPLEIGGFFNAYMLAFATEIFITTLDFVEWAPAGSDIFNPVLTAFDGVSWGAGLGGAENVPWAYTFIGRTAGGRRVRLNQYGAKTLSSNYRTTPGETAQIDAVINLLQGLPTHLLGIDGLVPVWKSYANNQVNDHWIKAVRP